MEREVEVWGRRYIVTVHMKSPSVWVASGEYMGQMLTTKDRSANAAIMRWREAAKYKGN